MIFFILMMLVFVFVILTIIWIVQAFRLEYGTHWPNIVTTWIKICIVTIIFPMYVSYLWGIYYDVFTLHILAESAALNPNWIAIIITAVISIVVILLWVYYGSYFDWLWYWFG